MPPFLEDDIEKPRVFDLSVEVDLSELTDDELLFRESIIKAFFDNATRSGHPIYGFTIEILKKMHVEVVSEFKARGRDYAPLLDRHQKPQKASVTREHTDDELENKVKKIVEKTVEEAVKRTAEQLSPAISETGNSPWTINYNMTNVQKENTREDIDEK
jgi:hypothetical protein